MNNKTEFKAYVFCALYFNLFFNTGLFSFTLTFSFTFSLSLFFSYYAVIFLLLQIGAADEILYRNRDMMLSKKFIIGGTDLLKNKDCVSIQVLASDYMYCNFPK